MIFSLSIICPIEQPITGCFSFARYLNLWTAYINNDIIKEIYGDRSIIVSSHSLIKH